MEKIRYIKLGKSSIISQRLKLKDTIVKEVVYNGETWTYKYYDWNKGHPILEKNTGLKKEDGFIHRERITIFFDKEKKKPKWGWVIRDYVSPENNDPQKYGKLNGVNEQFLIDEFWNKTITQKIEYKHDKIVGKYFRYFRCCLKTEFEGNWSKEGIPIGEHKFFTHSKCDKYQHNISLNTFNRVIKYYDGVDDFEVTTYSDKIYGHVWSIGKYYNGYKERFIIKDHIPIGIERPTGKTKYFSDDGNLEEVRTISEDYNYDPVTIYHLNGNRIEGQYDKDLHNDNKIGVWTTYSQDGEILSRKDFSI